MEKTQSKSFDIAKDVSTLSAAREFAARMIPEAQGGSPFWSNAARLVLIASLVELQSTQPEKWGFADLTKKLTRPIEELAEAARIHFPAALAALGGGQQNVTTAGIQINLMSYLSVIFDLQKSASKSFGIAVTSNEDHQIDAVYVQADDGTLQASEDGDRIEVWSWPGAWNDTTGRESRGRYELGLGRYLHLLEDLKSSGVNSCREVLAAIADKAIQVTA